MATVATFTLEADEFPLGTIFTELPDVTVRLERVIPGTNGATPYFWVNGTKTKRLLDHFSDHPGVHGICVVDSVGDEHLLRCTWSPGYPDVIDAFEEDDLVLLSATGTIDGWEFEIRGESRKPISKFQSFCTENDIPVVLTELHALKPLETVGDVTDPQREALKLAYEYGYFNTPREATLAEIAEELGISQQALGSRLRRANRRLIEREIIDSP
jgi:predicted DNA binding protein